jgi:KH domain
MEQLVHLRLKSIYKAFKQNTAPHMNGKYKSSSSSSSSNNPSSRGRHHPQRLNDDLDFDDPDDPDTLFQAAKISAAAATSMYSTTSTNNHRMKPGLGSTSSSMVDRATRFKEEKEKADAAAAALLAELEEEEEENVKSKNKKKKKKKAKQHITKTESNEQNNNNNDDKSDKPNTAEYMDDDDDGSSVEHISGILQIKGEHLDRKPAAKNYTKSDVTVELEQDEIVDRGDQLEKDLCNLVATEDIDGLESLMESIKGIPGRAALRKNAKKALKKLRLANSPPQDNTIENDPTKYSIQPQSLHVPVRVLTPDVPVQQSDPNGYLQIISLIHNKPAAQCATPGSQHTNNAQSRSRSNSLANTNAPLKSECMMHVRPLIVGWMIGKGGQRIRDLMEESGARIWIDQDSMGANDPRVLYISGSRKNVEIAVGLLNELVLKYQPLPSTPHSRLEKTPITEKVITSTSASTTNGPNIPEPSDGIPALPLKPKMGPTTITNTVSIGATGDSRSRHVLTCDPRFVPLLIGRRGWTIKNIQDTTGAKVDIDQSSTPRKITISGNEDNVDKAVRMVQDVLSYPHSQLHGVTGNDTQVDVHEVTPPAIQTNALIQHVHLVPSPSIEAVSTDVPTPLSENVIATKIPGHSPPSSLIMTGDAKSTISASSSLSSTPEPMLPSSSHGQIPQIDLGPTSFSPQQQQGRDIFSSSIGGLQQGSYNQITHQSPLPQSSIFQSQNENSFYGSLDPKSQQIPPINQQPPINVPMPIHQYSPNQPNRTTFLPDQSSAFFPVHGQTQLPLQHPLASPPAGNMFGIGPIDPQINLHNTLLQNDRSISAVGSGFWNGIGSSQHNSIHGGINLASQHRVSTDSFQLHAAVDFLEHSKQHHSKPTSTVGEMNDVIGFSVPPTGFERTLSSTQDPMLHFPKGRDDAQMVDSLFGPTSTTTTSAENLLSGLNGLSLHRDEVTSGLWGNTDPIVNPSNLRESDDSILFGGLAPQKSESRFVWGESGHF